MMLWDKAEHTHRDIEAAPAWLFDLCAFNARMLEEQRSGCVTFVWVLEDLIEPRSWPTDELRDAYIRLLAKYIVWTFMFPGEHMQHCFRHQLGEILHQQGHLDDTRELRSYRHVDYPSVDQWSSPETPRLVKVTMHWAVRLPLAPEA
jgi:hypothetical protein